MEEALNINEEACKECKWVYKRNCTKSQNLCTTQQTALCNEISQLSEEDELLINNNKKDL